MLNTDLGPEFVFEALRTDSVGSVAAQGRVLRFLANVDPVVSTFYTCVYMCLSYYLYMCW
ncbi:hypothetical protein EON65_17185 [archaeon]|nr:MAG: hypothetical protein EON65_17185 [archaeon]